MPEGKMVRDHVILESSSLDGILLLLRSLEGSFAHVSATHPVETPDGRFVSSVHLSNDTTVLEIR